MNDRDINRIFIKGTVVREPQVNITKSSEKKVANFKIVTKRRVNDNTYTECHTIVAYDVLADSVETNVKTGSRVFIDGRLQTSTWTSKGGQSKQTIEVVAHEIEMLN